MKKNLGDIVCYTVGNKPMTLREVIQDVRKGPPAGASPNFDLRSTLEFREPEAIQAVIAILRDREDATTTSVAVAVKQGTPSRSWGRLYHDDGRINLLGVLLYPDEYGIIAALIVPTATMMQRDIGATIDAEDREAARLAESAKASLMPSPGKEYQLAEIVAMHKSGVFDKTPWLFTLTYWKGTEALNQLGKDGWTEVSHSWSRPQLQMSGPQPWPVGEPTGAGKIVAFGPASTPPAVSPRTIAGFTEGQVIDCKSAG